MASVLDLKLSLTEEDARRLFVIFDRNSNGVIDYFEFLEVIRGSLSALRQKIVERAF